MPAVNLSVKLLQYTGNPEVTVATAAKLCYSDAGIEEIMEGVESRDTGGFIRKLIGMNHLSPVEHASFTFGVEGVSRALLAQITRHRIASFSVKSQRYVKAGGDFNYIVPPAIRSLGAEAVVKYEEQMRQIGAWYAGWTEVLPGGEKGNEDARFVLPNAAETKFIMTMNARELLHFFRLRCCNRAQWEIRALAWEMLRLVQEVAPALFVTAGPACVAGACSEGKMNCGKAAEVRKFRAQLGKEPAKSED